MGMRVVRGRDWYSWYGNQDGGVGGIGTIIKINSFRDGTPWDRVAVVKWDHDQSTNNYACGANGRYKLNCA